ncbi:hypothetical protein [Microvirga thermotolerans]|uniref:Uncharacterized protein n=1 Tax=Microvirga thermotolerans TaxID=2651334 RepID=A0A5P9JVL0_9HYPH|nr:hypothetical protein [Microvirga thermotolerans]QFU15808.1 hypothetical protein GDR74_05990 [Microvirga thermotolerans]
MLPQLQYFHFGDNGLYYGNYGGLDYSAGVEDGTAQVPADPPPVDAYDQLFYEHDLALQQASSPAERLEAHIEVVEGVYGLFSQANGASAADWHI